MKLRDTELENKKQWEDCGFTLPQFDRKKMIEETKNNPEWIHFGAGNIFRAFPAAVCQELLNKGIMKTGIIVAEGYDYEIIEKCFTAYDNLTVLVTLKSNGEFEKKVVGSVAEALCVDTQRAADWNRLKSIFQKPTLKMVSFTITEKGYSLVDGKGEYLKAVLEDFRQGPKEVVSYIGKLVALCYERFLVGKLPLTLVSMDNCSHNGTKLEEAVTSFAKTWVENNLVEKEFLEYIKQEISYPWSMIDKITPRPADSVISMLESIGFEDTSPVITEKNTYAASFVNAEEPQYLIIEDRFFNGRLPLDQGGIIYTDKDTVDKVEKMKVCTCLNPLHTALAVFGCLLSYTKISDEMKDEDLVSLVKKIGYEEGLPVVSDPGIINPRDFIDEVIKVRLPNPFLPDTPQRIACDTSQKLSIRFGETIKAYGDSKERKMEDLTFIPMVLAGWVRYLMALDDQGNSFELSPDPSHPIVEGKVVLGQKEGVKEILKEILSNENFFGVDLYDVGLGEKVEDLFMKMIEGKGAVRETIKTYLG